LTGHAGRTGWKGGHVRVRIATESGRSDGRNEDWAGAEGPVAVVLDGLSEGAATGCAHGTPWYVDRLGRRFLQVAGDRSVPLAEALADAIAGVAADHGDTCDLGHPGTPCSTVTAIRDLGDGAVEYLVLSDSTLVVDRPGSPLVVTDRGVERFLGSGGGALVDLIHAQQVVRNRPGGYWVAQVDPAAAHHARTGTAEARRCVLLSDGAARPVVDFSVMDWATLVETVVAHGPARLIELTREWEDTDPRGVRWPRYKHRDDATVVVCETGTQAGIP
jgi:hypothetical protein